MALDCISAEGEEMPFPSSSVPPVGGGDGCCDGVGVAPVLLLWLMLVLSLLFVVGEGVVAMAMGMAALFGGKRAASDSFCLEEGDGSGCEALDGTFTGAGDTAPGVSSSLFSEAGNGVWTLLLVADAALSTEDIEWSGGSKGGKQREGGLTDKTIDLDETMECTQWKRPKQDAVVGRMR